MRSAHITDAAVHAERDSKEREMTAGVPNVAIEDHRVLLTI
jgi:hypothetical protein